MNILEKEDALMLLEELKKNCAIVPSEKRIGFCREMEVFARGMELGMVFGLHFAENQETKQSDE